MTYPFSVTQVKKILKQYNIHPKKRYGQNFLIDQNILDKIISLSAITKKDTIVEIGAGLGALTFKLAEKAGRILAIEIDRELTGALTDNLAGFSNIVFIFNDLLKMDLEQEMKNCFGETCLSYRVCANIPYYVTSPIIFYLLEKCPNMISATLMVQKEVADRILASPGSKDYGLLTIMVYYYCDVRFITQVSRNCFYPRPEVDSTVISIAPLKKKRVSIINEELLIEFIRAAFKKRRKTILNACAEFFKIPKTELQKQLSQLGINSNSRPENLRLEDFAHIVEELASIINNPKY
ncbi:MAG: 16S rRNA (adenine(1518)-N(6)/adenine(1519)-N(6))-dimethyltransferase RsmA [Syntrophomonadaceae bacterium]